MRKKLCILLATFTLTLSSSMTAFAAPEVMPTGDVFDAEYYAQNNPDVVVAFGTDKELLYSHYVNNGRAEGRLAYAPIVLSKEDPISNTEKRNQFWKEYVSGSYSYLGLEIKDKLGHSFGTSSLDGYFSDSDIEQFANLGELVEYAKSIDVYKYADEVTFANNYYYQELKATVVEAALANVNNGYTQVHYWIDDEEAAIATMGKTCMYIVYPTLKTYYGDELYMSVVGGHHVREQYDTFNSDGEGKCVRMGIYKSEEFRNIYHDNWYKSICKLSGK